MLGNSIFGNLLSQVPSSQGAPASVTMAMTSQPTLSHNATMLPGTVTVSLLQAPPQQQHHQQQQGQQQQQVQQISHQHAQQILSSQHMHHLPQLQQHQGQPQQTIQLQSQPQTMSHVLHQQQPQQQHIIPQTAQIIHAHPLNSQQGQPQQQQFFIQQTPGGQNFVILGPATPTMFVTSGGHQGGANFLTAAPGSGGGNIILTAQPGLNVVGNLGGLVQSLTAHPQQQTQQSQQQQHGGATLVMQDSNVLDGTHGSIEQGNNSFSGTTSTQTRTLTVVAGGNVNEGDSFQMSQGPASDLASARGGAFQCQMCERSYKYRHGLTQHVQQNHMGKRPFPCNECGRGFTRKAQLERHMRSHSGSANGGTTQHETYRCQECSEVFHMRESYLLHLRTHEKVNISGPTVEDSGALVPRCEVCHEAFATRLLLGKHYRQDHPNHVPMSLNVMQEDEEQALAEVLRMQEESGGASLADSTKAMEERLVQNGLPTHSAKIVARRRKRAAKRLLLANQQQHMQVNAAAAVAAASANGMPSRAGNHVCHMCGKRFLNHYGLKRHVRTHTGERPHDCDICGLSFMERSHMKQHRMTHTGETPYQCDYCQRGFNRKFSYERHMRWHNKGGLTYAVTSHDSSAGGPAGGGCSSGPDAANSMTEFLDSVVSEFANKETVSHNKMGGEETFIKQDPYLQTSLQSLPQGVYLTSGNNSFTMQLNSLSNTTTNSNAPTSLLYTTTEVQGHEVNQSGGGGAGGTATFLHHHNMENGASSGHPQVVSIALPSGSLDGFNLPVMTAVAIPASVASQHVMNGGGTPLTVMAGKHEG